MGLSCIEADYIAIQILFFLKEYGYSPNNILARKFLVKMLDGNEVTMSSAYRTLKNNINYVDDEIIDKINSFPCIIKKLKKDCNSK
jgi:hypothetical protein